MVNKSNFFYASDLAQLYNISKQTLIFYDKKDLFKPDYVDSNGYRMYSLKQFFILGIILDLKTMGFHLNDIKNFLEHRTPDDTLSLLNKQLHKLTKQIELTTKLCDNIKSKRYAHSRIRRIIMNIFLGITKEDAVTPPQYLSLIHI